MLTAALTSRERVKNTSFYSEKNEEVPRRFRGRARKGFAHPARLEKGGKKGRFSRIRSPPSKPCVDLREKELRLLKAYRLRKRTR